MPGFNIPDGEAAFQFSPRATIETRRRHRWRFSTLSESVKDILIYALKADRPKPVIDKITIHHGQDRIYIPGKNHWEPIDVTFYEVENPDAAQKITDWLQEVVLFDMAELNGDFRAQGNLEMLDGSGDPTWTAKLFNCWPVQMTPEQLDYSSSEISTITVTISYDKAQLPISD
jgi:hypothetical protein